MEFSGVLKISCFFGFLLEIRKKEKKAVHLLVGSRRGEGMFGALWSLAREEFSGL